MIFEGQNNIWQEKNEKKEGYNTKRFSFFCLIQNLRHLKFFE